MPLAVPCASLAAALLAGNATAQPAPGDDAGDRQVVERLQHLLGNEQPPPASPPAPPPVPTVERPARRTAPPPTPRAQGATPIVPDPDRVPERAYQLYWEVDVPLLAIAIVLNGARYIRSTEGQVPAACLTTPQGCNDSALNPLDRPFAGRYSPAWATASDVGLVVLALAPYYVLWPDQGFWNMVNDSTIINQAVLLSTAFQGLAAISSGRGRPYIYGDEAPHEVKYGSDGGQAYFSWHTTYAFAMSTSLFWTVNRRRPGSAHAWGVFAVGTTVASFVGVSRVMAGEAFPTDALAGAAVGAAGGTLIPALRESPIVVAPVPHGHGAALSWITVL